jgi:hypothetical protein
MQWTNGQEVLPRPEVPFGGYIAPKVQDSVKDFPKKVRAPNILLILTWVSLFKFLAVSCRSS